MRKSLPILFSLAAFVGGPMAAQAETPTMYVASYGGSTEKQMKSEIIPAFEKANNVKIVYVSGNSTDTLAKLQAQKGNQEIDVAIMDDGPMNQAMSFGFCEPAQLGDEDADIYDLAKMGKAVGIGLVATGIAYNKDYFKKQGWAAPTSWNDLADPKYKGKLIVPPITNTYGLNSLMKIAKINGGSIDNMDPGFKMFQDKIGPNVLAYVPSSGKTSELFQSGDAVIAVWGSGRLLSLNNTGFPGAFVYPKEGAVALMTSACEVQGSNVPKLAQKFIQYLVSPDVQLGIAQHMGWGPVNKKTKLPADLADSLPYGDKVAAMTAVDWAKVNPKRAQWTNRWTHTVER